MTERDWFTWHYAPRGGTVVWTRGRWSPDPLEEGARMFTFRGHHPRTGPVRHLS